MDKASVARFISLIVAILGYFGINVPSDLQEAVVAVIAAGIALYVAFKNNYLTDKGKEQEKALEQKGLK